ncbi:MAG: efflux RND transporter periplasmic adaptor subunit, partial [Bacteroidia bacterium]|nr:efflux RND transporter periplasmic adaptor subunit [Bacteroidia bacterium]
MKSIYIAFLSIFLFIISSCTPKIENTELESFPVTNPIRKDTTIITEYIADIQSVRNVEIRTRINGFLEKIHVDEGNYVTEGQLLFSINKKGYEEELQKAKAMVKSAIADAKEAEIQYQNTKKLFEKNIVSAAELEMLQLKLDAKNAMVEQAKAHESSAALNLSYTDIKAPFSGKIDRIPFKSGSLLNEGEL